MVCALHPNGRVLQRGQAQLVGSGPSQPLDLLEYRPRPRTPEPRADSPAAVPDSNTSNPGGRGGRKDSSVTQSLASERLGKWGVLGEARNGIAGNAGTKPRLGAQNSLYI